jgi:hypothetical protein
MILLKIEYIFALLYDSNISTGPMQYNNVPRSGARCYITHSHKWLQIFIKKKLKGS